MYLICYPDNFCDAFVLKESKATRPAAANPDIFQLLGLLRDFKRSVVLFGSPYSNKYNTLYKLFY